MHCLLNMQEAFYCMYSMRENMSLEYERIIGDHQHLLHYLHGKCNCISLSHVGLISVIAENCL